MLNYLFSKDEKRSLFFFILIFFFVFHVFNLHFISEEVCVFLCFFGLVTAFAYYMSKKATNGLKKTWYVWFIEGLDVFNLSLIYVYFGLFTLLLNKVNFKFDNFYGFFHTFFDSIKSISHLNFKGVVAFYENGVFNSLINININNAINKRVSLKSNI